MRFDSSSKAQHTLRKTWNKDPRLLRFSVVKMGTTLEQICKIGGKAEEWAHVLENEGSTGSGILDEQNEFARDAMGGSSSMGSGAYKFTF